VVQCRCRSSRPSRLRGDNETTQRLSRRGRRGRRELLRPIQTTEGVTVRPPCETPGAPDTENAHARLPCPGPVQLPSQRDEDRRQSAARHRLDRLTCLTFFFSRLGLEALTREEAAELLEREELLVFLTDLRSAYPVPIEDAAGRPMWSVNVVLGADDMDPLVWCGLGLEAYH